MQLNKMKSATRIVHSGANETEAAGSINTPIYQTSTFKQKSPGEHVGYSYSRGNNPTREAFEKCIAQLENGSYGLAFASGIAAVDVVMRMLKPGEEVITTQDIYGGSYRLFRQVFEPAGVRVRFVDLQQMSEISAAISGKTRMIWLESPTNPLMNVIDIRAVAALAKKRALLLAVDNTFATPYLQQPLNLGADIVVHSASKYIGGHSDLILGAIATNDQSLYERMKFLQNTCGAIPGPNDCFLALRGVRTLHLRMQRSCANAMKIAQFLAGHKKVAEVSYPGLPGHPGHDIAKQQMRDFGAVVSFSMKDDTRQAAVELLGKMQIFTLAESLGGVESLCGHPASMSHGSMPSKERWSAGIKDSLIRLSIGIEDAEDLLDDLEQALA